MAFEKIHRPLFAESKHVEFPNNNSVSTNYNGAFCKVRSTLLLSRRRLCNYLDRTAEKNRYHPPPPGGVLPYISYISICRSIGWGFCGVLVWKRVYTLPILVWNEAMKGTCFLTVHESRRKKTFNKEVFLVLKSYLFLQVGADKFQPPII